MPTRAEKTPATSTPIREREEEEQEETVLVTEVMTLATAGEETALEKQVATCSIAKETHLHRILSAGITKPAHVSRRKAVILGKCLEHKEVNCVPSLVRLMCSNSIGINLVQRYVVRNEATNGATNSRRSTIIICTGYGDSFSQIRNAALKSFRRDCVIHISGF